MHRATLGRSEAPLVDRIGAGACDGVTGAETSSRERAVIAAFSEITNEAVTAANLDDLLCLVGKQLCHLLRVTRCSLYLREADGRFHGAVGYCESDGDISHAVQSQEAGIPGDEFSKEVIGTQAPVLIDDVPHDPRPHRPTMEYWRVRTMLGVPLVFDGSVIGLIFVDSANRRHVFTTEDIALAELFARLAALFIRQAMLNAELKNKAAEVLEQKNALAHLADVHRQLTTAVLNGADIHNVVVLLRELSAKPIVLYDEQFEVLAWSAPPGLKMTQPPTLEPTIRRMRSVLDTLRGLNACRPSAVVPHNLGSGLGRRHLMCRLIIEGSPSGYLDIVEVGRGLGERDTKLAEHGATVLSLQLLSERRQIEAEGQARDDYLSDLLRNTRDEQQLARRGPQFGIELSEPHVLVRLSLDRTSHQLGASATRYLVAAQFRRSLHIPEPPTVGVPGAVIVMLCLRGTDGVLHTPQDLRNQVADVLAALEPTRHIRIGVISKACHKAEDFPIAHRELAEIDEIAQSFDWRGGALTVDELGLFRVIVSSGRVKEAVHFAHELVRPLQEHDEHRANNDMTLLDTWRAFVHAEGRVHAAADALAVHENTVRYRLGKIRDITTHDPTSLDALLSARLAFQILDLAGW